MTQMAGKWTGQVRANLIGILWTLLIMMMLPYVMTGRARRKREKPGLKFADCGKTYFAPIVDVDCDELKIS